MEILEKINIINCHGYLRAAHAEVSGKCWFLISGDNRINLVQ